MKKLHLSLIATIAALLLASTAWGLMMSYASQDTVPDGTVVDGVPIGGLQIDQSIEKLEEAWTAFEATELTITANLTKDKQQTWSLGELGFRVNREPVLQAVQSLREGSLLERARYRFTFPREHRMKLAWNTKQFEARIRNQWGWLDQSKTADATRRITTEDKIIYHNHREAYRIDMPVLSEHVRSWTADVWHQSGSDGADPTSSEGGTATLKLPIRIVQPELTLQKLKAQGVERKIAWHTTDYSASPVGRAFNVEATARTLQDWVLAPGEIFDYDKVIASAQAQYGFREAPVILNGELVPGIGGGICQVSSTLYQAALLAGLEIVERRNHSLPVSYMPLGQDATFSEGVINFRFRNTTGKHLVIRTETKNRKLTIKLFGSLPSNITYRISSNTVKTIDPPTREVPSAKASPGRNVRLTKGKPGYVVETYRTKLIDGKEVARERISRDTYKATPHTIGVAGDGISEDEATVAPPAEMLLEDGIGLAP